jgi:sigma-B regulation protein RsbU (phosphoserine phosphatase)
MAVSPSISDRNRLAAVRATGLLDTAPEPAFDRLASLAATLLEAPRAFVTLVDDRRSFWKAAIGLPSGSEDAPRENTVEESFCQYVVASDQALIVDDTARDPRTCDNPSVETMNVKAWAGFPIHAPTGEVLGSFCVVDATPRIWTERDVEILQALSSSATSEIALRAAITAEREARRAADAAAAQAGALARTLQAGLLPPALPEIVGLDIAARYRAAGEGIDVVGDFYDVFPSDAATWSFVIGDVSGTGIAAAKASALARYTLRAAAVDTDEPRAALRTLNDVLWRGRGDDAGFLTVAYLRLRVEAGDVRGVLSLGGHEPPLLRRVDGTIETLDQAQGTMLGCVAAPELTDLPVRLGAGDQLVLYTDGVLDARHAGERFGLARLSAVVAQDTATADALAERIDRAVAEFCGAPLADDAAVLVIRVNG